VFKLTFKSVKCFVIALFLFGSSISAFAEVTPIPLSTPIPPSPNYHLVGWLNTVLPGGGELLLGNYAQASFEAFYESGTFLLGYTLSNGDIFSLDGFEAPRPGIRNRKLGEISEEDQMAGDMFQEFGIKAHFVNIFDHYRTAMVKSGVSNSWVDQTPTIDLFKKPFDHNIMADPWVWTAISAVAIASAIDYYSQTSGTITQTNRLTPTSNVMYAFNYSVWQSFGSGAPEEMFYRGFLQNEFQDLTNSPFVAIALTTAIFSLSHEPGNGRYTAAIAGSYLGYLSYRNHGNLGPGIAVHFWSEVLLGIENFLLNQKGQSTTPPAALNVQIPF